MNNLIIRTALIKHNVRTWELAAKILCISEPTLYRKLRSELPEDEQRKISALIEQYAKKGEHAYGQIIDNV